MDDIDKWLSQDHSKDAAAAPAGDHIDAALQGESPAVRIDMRGMATPDKGSDYAAGRGANSSLQGLLSAVNGPMFGFGDEVIGALSAPLKSLVNGQSLGKNYRETRDYVRGAQDSYKDEYPWTSALTQVAAGAPMGVMALPEKALAMAVPKLAPYVLPMSGTAAAPMGVAAQAGRTGVSGALNGAIYGAGNSDAGDVKGVAADAARAGALSAVLGPTLSTGVRGIGAGVSNVSQRVSDSSAGEYAKRKVAEALARDAEGSLFSTGAANPVNQAVARYDTLGSAGAVADSAGQNTRQLLDTLSTLPGETKNAAMRFIRERQNSSAGRLIQGADDALGTNGQRLQGTVDSLDTARKQIAAPLYNELRATTVAQPSPALVGAVQAADELGATALAKKMATADRVPYTLDTANPANWSAGDIDLVKRGIGDKILSETNPTTGQMTALGVKLVGLQKDLVRELNSATTDPKTGQSLYANARAAYAGPSELIDAANAGRASLGQQADAVTKLTSSYTPSELEAFKIGTYEALRAKMGNSVGGRTEVMNMRQNPGLAEKIQAAFGDDHAFRQFAATASKEDILKRLGSFVGGGSQTAARGAGMADLDQEALSSLGEAARNAAVGHVPGALSSVWGAAKAAVSMPETTRNAMGQILLSQGAKGRQNLSDMAGILQTLNNSRSTQANVLGRVGTTDTNGIIGSGLYGLNKGD